MDFVGVKIALMHGNELLVIQRDNKPGLAFAGLWDFPGGGREGGETPEECVIREIEEELGITLKAEQIMWRKIYPAMYDASLNAYFMAAHISEGDIHSVVFGNEGRQWKMMPIQDFMESNEVVEQLKGRLGAYVESVL